MLIRLSWFGGIGVAVRSSLECVQCWVCVPFSFFFSFLSFFSLWLFPIWCRFWLCQPTFSSLKSGLSEVLLFLLQGSQADNPNSPIDKEIRRSVVGFRKSECCQMFLVTSIRSRGRFATSVPSTHSSADFLSASYFHERQALHYELGSGGLSRLHFVPRQLSAWNI